MKRQSDRQPMSLGQAKELVHAKVMEEQKGITTSALANRYYAAVSDYPALPGDRPHPVLTRIGRPCGRINRVRPSASFLVRRALPANRSHLLAKLVDAPSELLNCPLVPETERLLFALQALEAV